MYEKIHTHLHIHLRSNVLFIPMIGLFLGTVCVRFLRWLRASPVSSAPARLRVKMERPSPAHSTGEKILQSLITSQGKPSITRTMPVI